MSFQRITSIGSMRSSLKRPARALRATWSASSSICLIVRTSSAEPRRPLSPPSSAASSLGRAHEQRAELDRLARRLLDAVEAEQLGGVLGLVGHLVDREHELDEVLAVVRRLELRVTAEELGREPVALVLELLHVVLRGPTTELAEALLDRRARATLFAPPARAARTSRRCAGPTPNLIRRSPRPANHMPAATSAAAGIVSTQAKTMFPATPQRTADSRFVAPEPITAPEITCVVESG